MGVLLSRFGPWLVAAVALLGAALAASEAHAADARPAVAYALKGGTVTGGAITTTTPSDFERLMSARPEGGVLVQDKVRISGVGSSDFDMLLKRPIVSKKIVQAGAVALKSLPIVATGVALWDIYDALRVRPDGSGGLRQDVGVPPTGGGPGRQWRSYLYGNPTPTAWYGSREEACANAGLGTYENAPATYTRLGENDGKCRVDVLKTNPDGTTNGDPDRRAPLEFQDVAEINPICPASIDFENPADSIPAGKAPGLDGKCKTARPYHLPISPEGVAAWSDNFPGFSPDPVGLAGDAMGRGVDLAPYVDGPGQLTGPGTVPGPATTTTNTPAPSAANPNPAPVTTTTNTTVNITYNTNNYSTDSTTVTVNPDGSTTTAPAEPGEVCGLPGKPACKIDETGTPTAENPDETEARTAWARLKDIATDPASALPSLPGLSWGFQLPAGCSVIQLPAFEPFLTGVDVCQFQPMFHEVMSLVWIIGGLFGAIGLFWRDQMGIT